MKRWLHPAFVAVLLHFGCAPLIFAADVTEKSAPSATDPGPGPRAEFLQPEVDFGQIMPKEVRKHEFVVTNRGSAKLLITAVDTSCGCTTAIDWDREIRPGQSGKITIEFNPGNFNGTKTELVTVTSNDSAQPKRVLKVKATSWQTFSMQPAFANFLPVQGEPGAETKIIRVRNNAEQPATLQSPQSRDPHFKAELKTVREGFEFELHITYDPVVDATSSSTAITVETSSKYQPILTVPALAMPQPAIVVVPSALRVPEEAAGEAYQQKIAIRNNGRAALSLKDPTVNVEGIAVRLAEAQPGKLFYVKVSIPAGFRALPGQSAFISVKTSYPKFPEIRIPIFGTSTAVAVK